MLHWQRGIAIFYFITKFKAEYISYLKKITEHYSENRCWCDSEEESIWRTLGGIKSGVEKVQGIGGAKSNTVM